MMEESHYNGDKQYVYFCAILILFWVLICVIPVLCEFHNRCSLSGEDNEGHP